MGLTQKYRNWRAMARGKPEGAKATEFTNDESRGDKQELRLELTLVPGWAPGQSLKPPWTRDAFHLGSDTASGLLERKDWI